MDRHLTCSPAAITRTTHTPETSRISTAGRKTTPTWPCPSYPGSRTSARRAPAACPQSRARSTDSPLPAATFKIRRSTPVPRHPRAQGQPLPATEIAKGAANLEAISAKASSRVRTLAITLARARTASIDKLPLKCKLRCQLYSSRCCAASTARKP